MEQSLVQTLRESHSLPDEGLRELLESDDASLREELFRHAREVAQEHFGKEIYLRGLVEWSNVCRNDCLYCGIRRSNAAIPRYSLGREEILECCRQAWELGLRTFVLQGGENPAAAIGLADTVAAIRAAWPDAAITLSLGELPRETYALLRRSGADRYLLRHESASARHYESLHPAGMRLETRLQCLRELRELGFQTGVGMMVGSPGQTTDHLLADIRFIESFRPEMIGMGPFIPQKDTPFGHFPAGSCETTLRLYAILRLMLPKALIPTTTALSTLRKDGRRAGILAGANVIMPVFTPAMRRADYKLYEGKAALQADSAAILQSIIDELKLIGYGPSPSRGDYNQN